MSSRDFFNSMAYKWDSICNHDPVKIEKILDMAGIEEGYSILDVGCGTGVLVPFMYKYLKGGRMTCVDISENMIEVARGKYNFDNLEFVSADIMEYEPGSKYDLVMMYSCFPHFSDKRAVISKLKSLTKRGGKLCICHSESRQAINSMHRLKAAVAHDNLPEALVTSGIMENEGFIIESHIDSQYMYVVLGVYQGAV